jgi:hypothetical protein
MKLISIEGDTISFIPHGERKPVTRTMFKLEKKIYEMGVKKAFENIDLVESEFIPLGSPILLVHPDDVSQFS